MKFLLLFIGLCCCSASFFYRKDTNKKKLIRFFFFSGVFLIFFSIVFLLQNLEAGILISMITVTVVMSLVWYAIRLKDFPRIFRKLTDKQNNILRYSIFYIIILATSLFFYTSTFPSVKLEYGNINMGGSFGGKFKITDIQSVDTIRVYPKIGLRLGGFAGFGLLVGNFNIKDEEKTAKLYIWRNTTPYISIRMNNNRLFMFNFRNPDKTMEFYNQIKNEVNSN